MIKRNQIDNLLERVNNNLQYYYSNIQKVAICKGQQGYAIEVVIDGNQIDSYYKNLTKKQVYTSLEMLNAIVGDCAVISGEVGDRAKIRNTDLICTMIRIANEQNLD